ncbi:MAG TPA: SH3 domain-containing protein [Ramlibacter sp.]|jgi:hypothetical protein|nr:SH3 domain-containing protein [Ramlibacter sp.]
MIRIALRVLALFAFATTSAWAQEAAVTRRATELREAPGDQARSVAQLPAQTALTRTNERNGPWVQVRTASGTTGWVHLFDVGPANVAAPASGGSAVGGALRGVTSGVAGLFGGASRPQTGTTAGIRGLGAEDLAQAQPNTTAVGEMERLRQSEADARAFASSAALQPASVAPLTAPSQPARQNPQ